MAPDTLRPFTFTNLPPEVRDMIYTALFAQDHNSILVRENDRATDHIVTATNHGHALLRTCKAIHHETQRHAIRTRLVFTTEVQNRGYASTHQLPKLGQQLTGSLFLGVTTITVGVTDLWRVIRSLGSLETRLVRLRVIRAVVVKRMPYRYWKGLFPTVLSVLTMPSSTASLGDRLLRDHLGPHTHANPNLNLNPISSPSPSTSTPPSHLLPTSHNTSNTTTTTPTSVPIPIPIPISIPDLEHAKFRCHIRSHPMINEDEFYSDDDEDGYADDRGDVLFPRPTNSLTGRGLELHVCARWVLVERGRGNEVLAVVATKFDFTSGRILDVALRPLEIPADDGGVRYSTESLGTLERRAVLQAHES